MSRDYDLQLDKGDYGTNLIDSNTFLMEVKCINSMPIWLTHILAEMKIYPTSFSKYGKIYEQGLQKIS